MSIRMGEKDADVAEALHRIAGREHVSTAIVVRRALRAWLVDKGEVTP